MNDGYYSDLKEKLSSHPEKLDNVRDWLFVLGNTMRAMIENVDSSCVEELDFILAKTKSQDLKLAFDFCQGRFGGEGFSYRRHPNYFYLSMLVATFPEFDLSQEDQNFLKSVIRYNHYLLYEIKSL